MRKERKKTYFYGDRLAELIATKNLSAGDLLHFNMAGPQPRISIFYFGNDNSENVVSMDESDEEEDAESGEEDGESGD